MDLSFVTKMNRLGAKRRPFLFLLDFELEQPEVIPLEEVNDKWLRYAIHDHTNVSPQHQATALSPFLWEKTPIPFAAYQKAFGYVQDRLRFGDSYLVNLTFPTRVHTHWSLESIFAQSNAKYKVWYKNRFVSFSPEIFVQIKDGIITSNPMKGTIDATLPNAHQRLLHNFKETAEHHTIVDLIRNDLNRVATHTHVERFRYLDRISTHDKDLLQMSSKITARLPDDYHAHLGTIFQKLLPAGSVSGAPKKKTVEIIRQAERQKRGFYTGIVGIFDGNNVDSGVLIRFIEQKPDGTLFFRSGGGITVHSEVAVEYQELLDKVYVPIARKHSHSKPNDIQSRLSSITHFT